MTTEISEKEKQDFHALMDSLESRAQWMKDARRVVRTDRSITDEQWCREQDELFRKAVARASQFTGAIQ